MGDNQKISKTLCKALDRGIKKSFRLRSTNKTPWNDNTSNGFISTGMFIHEGAAYAFIINQEMFGTYRRQKEIPDGHTTNYANMYFKAQYSKEEDSHFIELDYDYIIQ